MQGRSPAYGPYSILKFLTYAKVIYDQNREVHGSEGLDQFCFKIGGEVRGSHPVVGNRVFYTKIFHIRVSNFSMK